jgi:hypothetical protein
MGTRTTLLRLAAASVLAAVAWQPAIADEGKEPAPAAPAPALQPITQATTIEAVPIEMTREGKEVIAQLRAGQMIDSGAVSVSELRPGSVDQIQLETYAATALKDRLRAGQALDNDALSISELRPGSVDQGQLQVYIAMADEPAATQVFEVDQTLVFLAAMSVAGGSEPVTMETASAIVLTRSGVMPRAMMGADGVWEFPRLPNADERELLVGEGSAWRVVENMESQLLFLGPDRRFGWDDFADIVNPLQHIPLINIAYRAMTGDEIHGAAQLVDLGMGPLAGVGTVFNLAMRETTGASMEDYAMAALFGPPEYYDSSSVGVFAQTPPDGFGIFYEGPADDSEQVATAVRRSDSR